MTPTTSMDAGGVTLLGKGPPNRISSSYLTSTRGEITRTSAISGFARHLFESNDLEVSGTMLIDSVEPKPTTIRGPSSFLSQLTQPVPPPERGSYAALITELISDSIRKMAEATDCERALGPDIASVDGVRARSEYKAYLDYRKERGLPLSRWEKS